MADVAKIIGTHILQPRFQYITENDLEAADAMHRCNCMLGLVYRLNALSSYMLERNADRAAHRSSCLSSTRSYSKNVPFLGGSQIPAC